MIVEERIAEEKEVNEKKEGHVMKGVRRVGNKSVDWRE